MHVLSAKPFQSHIRHEFMSSAPSNRCIHGVTRLNNMVCPKLLSGEVSSHELFQPIVIISEFDIASVDDSEPNWR